MNVIYSNTRRSNRARSTVMVAAALVALCAAVILLAHGDGLGQQVSQTNRRPDVKRYGMVIGLEPSKVDEYKKLHAAVWPDVLKMIRDCHIQNYSIYLRTMDDGRPYLFSYFEYTGTDFKADMAKMAADPTTKRWWSVCEPCQKPLASRAKDEWWAGMEEVFHTD